MSCPSQAGPRPPTARDISDMLSLARTLRDRGRSLLSRPSSLRRRARAQLIELRAEQVLDHLTTMPIDQVQQSTRGHRWLTVLERAGLRTVADVIATSPEDLGRIPGVGPQIAAQLTTAAEQLATTVIRTTSVRLDPDHHDRTQTALLATLAMLRRALDVTVELQPRIEAANAEIEELLTMAGPAARPLRMFFCRRSSRDAAQVAAGHLRRFIFSATTTELASDLRRRATELDTWQPDAQWLWHDYQKHPASYHALLAGLISPQRDRLGHQYCISPALTYRIAEHALDTTHMRVSLRDYQVFGAKFALNQGRAILGDEMGLGKTVQAIAALAHVHATEGSHFLVVCPPSALLNWLHEIGRHSTLTAHRFHGPEQATALAAWAEHGGVAVTTFDLLPDLQLPPGVRVHMLVVDEAHHVSRCSAQCSPMVARAAASAFRVLLLTGTPVENRVDEFAHLVSLLQPDVAEHLRSTATPSDATQLRTIVSAVYLRRTAEDVLAELPDWLERDDWVEFGHEDFHAYREAVVSGNFPAMRRAAFVVGSPGRCAKLARLVEILDEASANGWKVVVFSSFRTVLDTVQAALGPVSYGPLTRSMPTTTRQKLLDAFSRATGTAVLLSQIDVADAGFDLQAASVVIIAEPQWLPAAEQQAIARCQGRGQLRKVQVRRLLARDSVDQRISEAAHRTKMLCTEYARPEGSWDADPDAAAAAAGASESDGIAVSEEQILRAERARLGISDGSATRAP